MRKKVLSLVGATGLAACAALMTPGTASASAVPAAVSSAGATLDYYAPLTAVAANRVTGSGGIWISLTGNSAKFTLVVSGLISGAPHPAQLWIDGKGQCPGTAQAAVHNGHKSISITDEAPVIGTVGAALTTSGDTSSKSALAMPRFPTASNYTYTRTFSLDTATADAVKNGTAVLVVHGIDYNGNGKYDSVLGATPGHASLPAEATAPALCGSFVAAQMKQAVPMGSADTGGGGAASTSSPAEIGLGVAALVGAIGAAVLAFRRRPLGQSPEAVVTNGSRRFTT